MGRGLCGLARSKTADIYMSDEIITVTSPQYPSSDPQTFESWYTSTINVFKNLSEDNKNVFIQELVEHLPAEQRLHLCRNINLISSIDFIADLPAELALQVLQYLDTPALFTACQVSKYWNKLITSEGQLWRNRCKYHRILLATPPTPSSSSLDPPPNPSPSASPLPPVKALISSFYRSKLLEYSRMLRNFKHNHGYTYKSLRKSNRCNPHSSRTFGVAASTNTIFTGSDDRHIKAWSCQTLAPVFEKQAKCVSCLDATDTLLLAGLFDGSIPVYNASDGELIFTCSRHMGPVYDIKHDDGLNVLVSGSSDCTVRVWCLETGAMKNVLRGHETMINRILLLPSGLSGFDKDLIFSMDIARIIVWDVGSKAQIGVLSPEPVKKRDTYLQPGLLFTKEIGKISPGENRFVVSGSSQGIIFWDAETFDVFRIVRSSHYHPSESVVGVGSALIAITSDEGIALIDSVSGDSRGQISVPQFNNSNCGVWLDPDGWLDGNVEGLKDKLIFVATTSAFDVLCYYLETN